MTTIQAPPDRGDQPLRDHHGTRIVEAGSPRLHFNAKVAVHYVFGILRDVLMQARGTGVVWTAERVRHAGGYSVAESLQTSVCQGKLQGL